MKKNMKKSLGFLALLLMVGLVASFTPGLISALEVAPPAASAATEEVRICPVTDEPCDEDCTGLVASDAGAFSGRMYGAVNAPVEGSVAVEPIRLGEGNMNGAVNAPVKGSVAVEPIRLGEGNMNGAVNGPGEGAEDGLRTRQLLQDGTAAGGQQRARAQDGTNCVTDTVPAG